MLARRFKCELCSNTDSEVVIDTIRHNYFGNYIKHDVHICKNCSLIQLHQFRDAQATIKYYKYEYLKKTYNYTSTPNSDGDTAMSIFNQKKRGQKVFKFLLSNKKLFHKKFEDIDVLDVGCGPGGTTDAFLKKVNSIIGIEPVIESVKLGKKVGYPVEHGFLEKLNRPSKSCDLIILLGTIEHAYDLNKSMKESIRVLRDNGKIFIRWRSDNIWGSPIEYFNSNHYRYFNSESIRFLADKFNLKIILKSKNEIEGKPGANYFILEKQQGYKVSQNNRKYNYKKTLNFFKEYEYLYFKISSDYIRSLRLNKYDKKNHKKYIKNKKNKIRVLSQSEFHIERSVIEAKEFISYFINV